MSSRAIRLILTGLAFVTGAFAFLQAYYGVVALFTRQWAFAAFEGLFATAGLTLAVSLWRARTLLPPRT